MYDKIIDSKFFEKWFKEMFLNEVEENKAIVMDNATFHCKNRLHELCKNANKNLKIIITLKNLFTNFFKFDYYITNLHLDI